MSHARWKSLGVKKQVIKVYKLSQASAAEDKNGIYNLVKVHEFLNAGRNKRFRWLRCLFWIESTRP